MLYKNRRSKKLGTAIKLKKLNYHLVRKNKPIVFANNLQLHDKSSKAQASLFCPVCFSVYRTYYILPPDRPGEKQVLLDFEIPLIIIATETFCRSRRAAT